MKHRNNIIILTIIFIIISVLFWGKTGNMLIDFSREAYIPYQMQTGKILTKDILLIYGAFGYIVNSFLYSILTNINLIILEAHIIAYSIIVFMYFILNVFFTKKASLILTIAFILTSVISNATFSFILPYSYSTLWAVLGSYGLLYSILYKKKILIFTFLGLICASRIEFFVPLFIITLSYLAIIKKPFLKELSCVLIFPILTLIYFIINKITLIDFTNNYEIIKEMMNADSLKYLYKGMGVFFERSYFNYNLIQFAKILVIFAISHLFFFIRKPNISYIILIVSLCFINTNFSLNLIGFIAILLTLSIYNFKKIKKEEILLLLFALILCSKAIFAINPLSYSNFGYFLIIIYTYLQLQKLMNKKWLINALVIFMAFGATSNISHILINKKVAYETKLGTIYINKKEITLFEKTNNFIKEKVKQDEDFIVVPEGQIFNLIHKKNHNYTNSTFTPLDFEAFGEENIIKNTKNEKPSYIIFYPRNTMDYGKKAICEDYGVDFCKYVIDNYKKIESIEESNRVAIYKIKR